MIRKLFRLFGITTLRKLLQKSNNNSKKQTNKQTKKQNNIIMKAGQLNTSDWSITDLLNVRSLPPLSMANILRNETRQFIH